MCNVTEILVLLYHSLDDTWVCAVALLTGSSYAQKYIRASSFFTGRYAPSMKVPVAASDDSQGIGRRSWSPIPSSLLVILPHGTWDVTVEVCGLAGISPWLRCCPIVRSARSTRICPRRMNAYCWPHTSYIHFQCFVRWMASIPRALGNGLHTPAVIGCQAGSQQPINCRDYY